MSIDDFSNVFKPKIIWCSSPDGVPPCKAGLAPPARSVKVASQGHTNEYPHNKHSIQFTIKFPMFRIFHQHNFYGSSINYVCPYHDHKSPSPSRHKLHQIAIQIQSSHRGSKPYVSISGAAASSAKIQRCFRYGRGWISFSKIYGTTSLEVNMSLFHLFLCQHLRPFETIRMSESYHSIIQTHHWVPNHSSQDSPHLQGPAIQKAGKKHIFLAHVDDHSKCTCAGSMAMICLRADEPRENVLSIA